MVTPTGAFNSELQPVPDKERISSLDTLRGLALLGILLMNIQSFAMIRQAYENPTAYGDLTGANFWVWLLSHTLAEEKFMAIFSLLFGAGIVLMTSRIERSGRSSRGIHLRRMGWLILFGLAHAYLIWSGDILVYYGVTGLFVYPLRKCKPATLLTCSLVLITAGSVVFLAIGMLQPFQQETAKFLAMLPAAPMPLAESAAYQAGWLAQMQARVPSAIQAETYWYLVLYVWRISGLMLAGMALMKLKLLEPRLAASRYWIAIGAAVFVGIPATLLGVYFDFSINWYPFYTFYIGNQINYWASLVVAAGWIGATLLLCKTTAARPITRCLAAVGRMAFTNYLMQSFLCMLIFYGTGLGLFGKIERAGQAAIVIGIWALQLVLSSLWIKYFQFGPMEWLWRSLTYLQAEPFRRHKPTIICCVDDLD